MKNFYFNWMKNAAKNTQTTGGGLRGGVRMRINLELPLSRYRVDTVSILCRCRVLDMPQVSPAG